jgi:hypothetical protein
MAQAQKTIAKIKRKERKVKEAPLDAIKMHKTEEILQASPGAFKLSRGIQRRMDNYFGINMVSNMMDDQALEYSAVVTSIARFDYDAGAGEDYGLKVTLPAAVKLGMGLTVGDLVHVREGALEGRMLTVVADSSSTEVRCEDVATFTSESSVAVRVLMSADKKAFV